MLLTLLTRLTRLTLITLLTLIYGCMGLRAKRGLKWVKPITYNCYDYQGWLIRTFPRPLERRDAKAPPSPLCKFKIYKMHSKHTRSANVIHMFTIRILMDAEKAIFFSNISLGPPPHPCWELSPKRRFFHAFPIKMVHFSFENREKYLASRLFRCVV